MIVAGLGGFIIPGGDEGGFGKLHASPLFSLWR